MFAALNQLLTRAVSGYFLNKSLRFRSSASAYLNRTLTTPTSSTIYTWSGWVKRGALSATGYLFGASTTTNFGFNSSDQLLLTLSGTSAVTTTAVYRDPAAWYHLVYVQNGATQTIYVNGVSAGTGTTANTVFNTAIAHQLAAANTTSYFDGELAEVNFVDGQALAPTSFGATGANSQWLPKAYAGTYGTNGFYLPFTDATLSTLLSAAGNISAPYGGVATNALVADGVYCTSNVSAGGSFTFLLNTFSTATQITRYSITNLSFTGGASTFAIQSSPDNSTWTTFASLSVTASNLSFSGSINTYAKYFRLAPVAFGTNGSASVDAFLLYQDGLGLDSSGNGNNWTPNNISVTAGSTYDSLTDVPTLTSATVANYATGNPLYANNTALWVPFSMINGNLSWGSAATNANQVGVATMAMSGTNKTYWEVTIGTNFPSSNTNLGIALSTTSNISRNEGIFYRNDGSKNINGTASAYGSSYTVGDVIGFAYDAAAGTLVCYKNNVSQGTLYSSGAGLSWVPAAACDNAGVGVTYYNAVNFGQQPFVYTPPSGFLPLNTFNIAAGTVTTSGTFTGNLSTDGPMVYLNGTPTAMTINGNAVTFGTQADKLANGFKVRSSSVLYNLIGSNTYVATTVAAVLKYENAQPNP